MTAGGEFRPAPKQISYLKMIIVLKCSDVKRKKKTPESVTFKGFTYMGTKGLEPLTPSTSRMCAPSCAKCPQVLSSI